MSCSQEKIRTACLTNEIKDMQFNLSGLQAQQKSDNICYMYYHSFMVLWYIWKELNEIKDPRVQEFTYVPNTIIM